MKRGRQRRVEGEEVDIHVTSKMVQLYLAHTPATIHALLKYIPVYVMEEVL